VRVAVSYFDHIANLITVKKGRCRLKPTLLAVLALGVSVANCIAGEILEIPEAGGIAVVPDGWADIRYTPNMPEVGAGQYRVSRDTRSIDSGMFQMLVAPQDAGIDPATELDKMHKRLLASTGRSAEITHSGNTTVMGMSARYIIAVGHRTTDGQEVRMVSLMAMDMHNIIFVTGSSTPEAWDETWRWIRGFVNSMHRK
jgi:hypothetical protein